MEAVNNNVFHLFTATYNAASQQMKVFVDGALQGTNLQVAPEDDDEPLVIGARANLAAAYVGQLDDVAIWNETLSAVPEPASLVLATLAIVVPMLPVIRRYRRAK
jgi:hypothetical protein